MRAEMKPARNKMIWSALVVLLSGFLLAALICQFSGLRGFPSRLADIYREEQHSLTVPGSRHIQLNRPGAYGIYFQYSLVKAAVEPIQFPPELECRLDSLSGEEIRGVPDYQPSNRYWSRQGGGPATLIQSISIEDPGQYEFSCQHPGDYSGPDLQVTIGPNYTWEFIRTSLEVIPALVGIYLSLTIPVVVSICVLIAGLLRRKI